MGTTSNCELCLKLKLPTYNKHASKTIDLKKEKNASIRKQHKIETTFFHFIDVWKHISLFVVNFRTKA